MKGQFHLEFLWIIVFAFVFCTSTILAYKIMTEFQANSGFATGSVAANITDMGVAAIQTFDYGAAILIFGQLISIIILGFLVRSHPVLMIPALLFLTFLMLIAPVISNAFEYFAQSDELVSSVSHFTVIQYIMTYLPLIIGVFGFLFIIVMYSKGSGETGY